MNTCIFMGRIGSEPEAKQTQSGKTMVTFSLAIDTGKKDQSGARVSDWFNFVAFDSDYSKTASTIQNWVHSGDQIAVEARATVDQWLDKTTGAKRSAVKFIVSRIHFGAKNQKNQGDQPPASRPAQNPPGYGPRPNQRPPAPARGPASRPAPQPETEVEWDSVHEQGDDEVPY